MKSILALSAFAATALAREYSPMVEDAWYGYSAYSHDGWWGAGVLGHADIAAGGEWPWWSDNEYMVNQINLYAKGYFNLEAWIQLAIFKIHLTGEFIAAEIDGVQLMTKWDAPKYNKFCYSCDWHAEAVTFTSNI
jgi:hypothetical protein